MEYTHLALSFFGRGMILLGGVVVIGGMAFFTYHKLFNYGPRRRDAIKGALYGIGLGLPAVIVGLVLYLTFR